MRTAAHSAFFIFLYFISSGLTSKDVEILDVQRVHSYSQFITLSILAVISYGIETMYVERLVSREESLKSLQKY